MRNHRNTKAFTLIELMVVIAIISILMSTLFVGGKKAYKWSLSAKCKNHLRNLHTAVMNFSLENGGHYYPRAGSYEFYRRDDDLYHQANGWIRWQGSGSWPNKKSQRDKMVHAHFAGDAARKSA